MKKIVFIISVLTGLYSVNAQGIKAGFGAGYATEFETVVASADLVYGITDKIGVGTTVGFGVAESDFSKDVRNTIFFVDLNGRYKVFKELYALAGIQYLSNSFSERGGNVLPLGATIPENTSDFGANLGAGYIYNIIANVNIFAEAKYTFIQDNGYVYGRLGLIFDL